MARYLIIESSDPFDSQDSGYFSELVQGITGNGNKMILFLVQNGVLPVRKGSKHSHAISRLIKNKVQVLADGFSLKERAIKGPVEGVQVSDVESLVDFLLEPGTKSIWH